MKLKLLAENVNQKLREKQNKIEIILRYCRDNRLMIINVFGMLNSTENNRCELQIYQNLIKFYSNSIENNRCELDLDFCQKTCIINLLSRHYAVGAATAECTV